MLASFMSVVEVADGGALIDCGHEGATVVLSAAYPGGRLDGDEAGQILVLGAESVAHPSSHAWAHELEASRVELDKALGMDGGVCVHAVEQTELVGVLGEMGKEFGNG